jgi:hypothetical protein
MKLSRTGVAWRVLLALAALSGAAGCGEGCKSEQTPSSEPESTAKPEAKTGEAEPGAAPSPATGTAVVEGGVRLAAGAELPMYPDQNMEKEVLQHTKHAALPESCTPPKTTDRQPVQVTP